MDLPVSKSQKNYDVIVCGGGPAGVCAALAAARSGAKVLLLERSGALGGTATAGLVASWCPMTDGKKLIHGGIGAEIVRKTTADLKCLGTDEIPHNHISFDPEYLKFVLDQLVLAENIEVLFFAVLAAARVEEKVIKSVIVADKRGLEEFTAPVFIDGTGDGDLGYFAGAEFQEAKVGEEEMPGSLCFNLANVDDYNYTYVTHGTFGGNPASPIWKIMADPQYDDLVSMHLTSNLVGPSVASFNAGHLYFDAVDPESLSAAMFEGRKVARRYTQGLRDWCGETFGAAHLSQTANMMGIRESRRLKGVYTLTIGDYLARRDFDDSIGRNCYYVDIHQGKGKQNLCRTFAGWQEYMNQSPHSDWHCKPGESHGVPFRIMQSPQLDNYLAAGRCVSSDKGTYGSIRVMPNAMTIGEAAGIAAAQFADQKLTAVGQISIPELRNQITARGGII